MREIFQAPPVFIEITPASLKALREDGGIELPLERTADGKLTDACRDRTIAALRHFAARKNWQPGVRALCAISVHGVSLRTISLPATTGDALERMVRLQIENEFPLPPDALAWGWREISRDSARLEAVIVVVRKETIEHYDSFLSAAGLNAEFTVAAFARAVICPKSDASLAILEIGRNYHELASFQNGVPVSLKILSAGADISGSVLKHCADKTICLSGVTTAANDIFEQLSQRAACRRLEVSAGPGSSAATQGLKQAVEADLPLLRLQAKADLAKAKFHLPRFDFSEAETRRWLVRGAALLLLLLIFPFAEALLMKPLLARKLDALKNERQQFASLVDPEMEFLQALKQSQPPYLDALYVFSKAAPPGSRLDTLTMNQHGDIQLKATLQSAQQVMDFRSKLIDTGFFDNIAVEDQTPVLNQPKVAVRMTARWKPAAARAGLKIYASPDGMGKTNVLGDAASRPGVPKTPPT